MNRRELRHAAAVLDLNEYLEKLFSSGFSVEDIKEHDLNVISSVSKVPGQVCLTLQELAKFEPSLLNARNKTGEVTKLTVGVSSLDALLGGGFYSGRITQFLGEPATGKTQLLMQLCVTSQLKRDVGGLDSTVLYIDAKGDFAPQRVAQIAQRFNEPSDRMLSNIALLQVFSATEFLKVIFSLESACRAANSRVVLIDSASFLFMFEPTQASRSFANRLFARAFITLASCVKRLSLTVVDVEPWFKRMPYPPSLQARVILRRGPGSIRLAQISASPFLPGGEQPFIISEDGLVDLN
jgi:DNA repair protein RadA